MEDAKTFTVWEPAIEADKHDKVEACTIGQAAFFAANEREIGHRSATFTVFDGTQRFSVEVTPQTTYQVGLPVTLPDVA